MKFPPIRVLLSGKSSYRRRDSGGKVSGEMQSNLKGAVAQTHFTVVATRLLKKNHAMKWTCS